MAVLEEIEDDPPARAEAPTAAPAAADDSDSDDEPPPLETAAAQLEALNLRRQVGERVDAARIGSGKDKDKAGSAVSTSGGVSASSGSTATPTDVSPKPKPAAGMKKGFFDAPPRAARHAKPKAPEMVYLKGSKTKTCIPDFMRVELEGSEATEKMKKQLLESLKPDKETIDGVMGNSSLMAGFDDPEVMAAVEDVAKDPRNMAKYANNAKVVKFYQNMAGMVGDRLAKKGDNSTSGV